MPYTPNTGQALLYSKPANLRYICSYTQNAGQALYSKPANLNCTMHASSLDPRCINIHRTLTSRRTDIYNRHIVVYSTTFLVNLNTPLLALLQGTTTVCIITTRVTMFFPPPTLACQLLAGRRVR